MRQRAFNKFSQLEKVRPYEYKIEEIYKENATPVVLTEARNVSQAEIRQTFKFETNNDIKDKLTILLMNAILSSSDTIGLFNSLRETDHLAYRVNSSISKEGNCGEESLFILTSTDNKDTGVTSYENLQKSINGLNRQINKLLNSEYKDSDLETAKRALKAEILMNESAVSKMGSLMGTLELDEDLTYDNRKFEMIDSITREDIDSMAKKVFAGKPVYSIIASQDTLDYNKGFLSGLERN
jgi:predicted Zn-dependent peptidase